MSFTNTVIELTRETPLQAVDIASRAGLSIGYVRTQLRLMELSGVIERVDNRTPIFYRPSVTNAIVRNMEEVEAAKKALLTGKENDMTKFIFNVPKNLWPKVATAMEIYSAAIKELDSEGKLIETL